MRTALIDNGGRVKEEVSRDFRPSFFINQRHLSSLINRLKQFRICLRIRRDIRYDSRKFQQCQ
jgi:hypothetical protein